MFGRWFFINEVSLLPQEKQLTVFAANDKIELLGKNQKFGKLVSAVVS